MNLLKMKKIILLLSGTFLVLYSLITGVQYIGDYSILTAYGKGIVLGKILLFVIGIVLVVLGIKKKKLSASTSEREED